MIEPVPRAHPCGRLFFLMFMTKRRSAVACVLVSGILYTSMSRLRDPAVPVRWRLAAKPARCCHLRRSRRSSRIDVTPSFKHKAYAALKNAIVAMDIYRSRDDIRLDERKLAQEFGISRTPVREAMAQLEREGFVRSVPRRGIYVVRKTKREVIEMITAWAALESMAARLITQNASDEEIAGAAQNVRDLRERQVARASRRIFRGQHRVSPDDHPA